MGVTIRGDFSLAQMKKVAESIDGKKVIIGPTGTRNRNLAKIHEYGVTINVTDKMRNFLASQGLHLKKSTTTIHIPERSFIRNGWDSNANEILNRIEGLVADVVHGKSVSHLTDGTGDLVVRALKEYAKDLDSPSLHPFTIERKGSTDPLIDSGGMVGSIDYEVK